MTQVVLQDAVETISAEQQAREALTVRILELEEAQGEDAGLKEAQLQEALQNVSAVALHVHDEDSVCSSGLHKAFLGGT